MMGDDGDSNGDSDVVPFALPIPLNALMEACPLFYL